MIQTKNRDYNLISICEIWDHSDYSSSGRVTVVNFCYVVELIKLYQNQLRNLLKQLVPISFHLCSHYQLSSIHEQCAYMPFFRRGAELRVETSTQYHNP